MQNRTANNVECYIVRIYRRDAQDASRAAGVVEGPGGDLIKVFHNGTELLKGLDIPEGRGSKARRTTMGGPGRRK